MSLHSAQHGTPASQLAASLLNTTPIRKPRTGRHRRTVVDMARAGEWHAMWCRLGDVVDETIDVAIAWFAVAAGVAIVLGIGVTLGFAGGPVAALAYIVLLIVAVLVWFRWGGGQP
jgi:hypothetical protein